MHRSKWVLTVSDMPMNLQSGSTLEKGMGGGVFFDCFL